MVDDTHTSGPSQPPQPHARDVYTVANIVTVLRLMLVPFFFSVFITEEHDLLSFALFTLAASTDWLDGQIARRTGTVTELGKIIDPLVDRLLIAAGVLGLFLVGRLPAWVVVVLLVRDAYLLAGAWVLERAHAQRVEVSFIGKLTTALLLVGFAGLTLNMPLVAGLDIAESEFIPGLGSEPTPMALWLVYAGIVTSLMTAGRYTLNAYRSLRIARSQDSPTRMRENT